MVRQLNRAHARQSSSLPGDGEGGPREALGAGWIRRRTPPGSTFGLATLPGGGEGLGALASVLAPALLGYFFYYFFSGTCRTSGVAAGGVGGTGGAAAGSFRGW
jgi:hypothetical protein